MRNRLDLHSKRCVVVFIKAPEAGKVKTRLARKMDQGLVMLLYQHFVEDILAMVSGCGVPLRIFFYPPEAKKVVTDWLRLSDDLKVQAEGTLGMKMARAFSDTFHEGFNRVLLIGTDFPDLTADVIQEGFTKLDQYDAVIGPTFDGGYYLIGLKPETHRTEWFDDISWSTQTVFDQTMARFSAKGFSVHLLPQWRDIDTYDDLRNFMTSAKKETGPAVKTMQFLREIGLV